MLKSFVLPIFITLVSLGKISAQSKLSIDNVHAAYLRNSGTIMEKNEIKGYFFFYMSDKIDRNTNEYTLQILDQNLNKVVDIKFEDSKRVNLLESAYNGQSLSFLFKNNDSKTLDLKVYDISGKLKYTYSREFDRRTDDLMKQYAAFHTDEGTNQNIFDLGEKGYVSILPLREGTQRTYQVDFFSSESKKQWTYTPMDQEKYSHAEYLGSTDSLIFIQVMKKSSALSGKLNVQLVGINFVTRKKAFEIDSDNEQYQFLPTSIVNLEKENKIMVMGNYFDADAKVHKDYSKGLAIYEINSKGKILSQKYNSWTEDFSAHLPTNKKGKIDELGFLFVHKTIKTPDGKVFVVGEGYKRKANAGGIALNVLAAAGGGTSGAGNTKIVVTDMVLMEFDEKYSLKNASIYEKTSNTAESSSMSDYNSQHMIAVYLKAIGAFDYEFTTSDSDNSNFAICYSDWVRGADYKGKTFNSIRYNGEKFITDKIELKSDASRMKVFPAKAGSIMILEYYKKTKKLEFRLEKIG